MILFTFTVIFTNTVLLLNFVGTEDNITIYFEIFKKYFHKVYKDSKSEQKGYENFVNNWKVTNKLNKEHPTRIVSYQLNRYADQDPEEIKERYAINIMPYDHVVKEDEEKLLSTKFIEDIPLYDLNTVDDLYNDWMKKWGKESSNKTKTKKIDKMVHYYRFVKTVSEINKKRFAGEIVTLGPDADIVHEPNEYFYG